MFDYRQIENGNWRYYKLRRIAEKIAAYMVILLIIALYLIVSTLEYKGIV